MSADVKRMRGTAGYTSPEMAFRFSNGEQAGVGKTKIDKYKTDIWSLGCVVADFVRPTADMVFVEGEEELVFGNNTALATILNFVAKGGRPKLVEGVDKYLVKFLEHCWTISPSERPSANRLLASDFVTRVPLLATTTIKNWQQEDLLTPTECCRVTLLDGDECFVIQEQFAPAFAGELKVDLQRLMDKIAASEIHTRLKIKVSGKRNLRQLFEKVKYDIIELTIVGWPDRFAIEKHDDWFDLPRVLSLTFWRCSNVHLRKHYLSGAKMLRSICFVGSDIEYIEDNAVEVLPNLLCLGLEAGYDWRTTRQLIRITEILTADEYVWFREFINKSPWLYYSRAEGELWNIRGTSSQAINNGESFLDRVGASGNYNRKCFPLCDAQTSFATAVDISGDPRPKHGGCITTFFCTPSVRLTIGTKGVEMVLKYPLDVADQVAIARLLLNDHFIVGVVVYGMDDPTSLHSLWRNCRTSGIQELWMVSSNVSLDALWKPMTALKALRFIDCKIVGIEPGFLAQFPMLISLGFKGGDVRVADRNGHLKSEVLAHPVDLLKRVDHGEIYTIAGPEYCAYSDWFMNVGEDLEYFEVDYTGKRPTRVQADTFSTDTPSV